MAKENVFNRFCAIQLISVVVTGKQLDTRHCHLVVGSSLSRNKSEHNERVKPFSNTPAEVTVRMRRTHGCKVYVTRARDGNNKNNGG